MDSGERATAAYCSDTLVLLEQLLRGIIIARSFQSCPSICFATSWFLIKKKIKKIKKDDVICRRE